MDARSVHVTLNGQTITIDIEDAGGDSQTLFQQLRGAIQGAGFAAIVRGDSMTIYTDPSGNEIWEVGIRYEHPESWLPYIGLRTSSVALMSHQI